mmetsp:Transcript_45732/g.127487  ORF Transcript_45732/g.127487 Transcript_45732/m.127487 type:complete len:212 (+) Transcript_45732:74-709(+)
MGAAECKPCSAAEPTTDTVKVDQTLLASAPLELENKEEDDARLQRVAEAEEARRQEEAAEQERERQRLAEEAAAEERRVQEEAAAAAAQQQQQQEQADAAAKEAADSAAATAGAAEPPQDGAAEREAAEKKVAIFLRARGFKSISAPRTSCFKTTSALHVAVEENGEDMVRALLLCGADASKKNSAGKTPKEWAQKLNKKGSRSVIVSALA